MTAAEDRLLTLAELATYLHMTQKTVRALAENGTIPGKLIGKEWRFRRASIDSWLESQEKAEQKRFEDVPDGMQIPLDEFLPESAIIHDMRAKDALAAIEELAARAYSNRWLKDKPWFVGAVVEREALASTAMEGGVAFLHTRSREADRIARPFIIVGRSYEGIDFGAPDGRPTYLFFLLGLKHDRLHLPLLGRLARIMARSPEGVARLRAATSSNKMLSVLLRLDNSEMKTRTKASPEPGEPAGKSPLSPKLTSARATLDREARLRQIRKLQAQRKAASKGKSTSKGKTAAKSASKAKGPAKAKPATRKRTK